MSERTHIPRCKYWLHTSRWKWTVSTKTITTFKSRAWRCKYQINQQKQKHCQQTLFLFIFILFINFQSQSRVPRNGASEQELEKKIDAIGTDVDADVDADIDDEINDRLLIKISQSISGTFCTDAQMRRRTAGEPGAAVKRGYGRSFLPPWGKKKTSLAELQNIKMSKISILSKISKKLNLCWLALSYLLKAKELILPEKFSHKKWYKFVQPKNSPNNLRSRSLICPPGVLQSNSSCQNRSLLLCK